MRARILNRNVIVVSSYRQVREVLDNEHGPVSESVVPRSIAGPAYWQLMQDFFTPPNLLLEDGERHMRMKTSWQRCIHSLQSSDIESSIRRDSSEFFDRVPRDAQIDLYKTMKKLSWKLFLRSFLDLDDADPDFDRIVELQEDLLRGQFSLIPTSVNLGFWHSPRKRDIDSRKGLQDLILRRLDAKKRRWCSAEVNGTPGMEERINHILMGTSSLAVEGLASLVTALLLNLFVFTQKGPRFECLAEWVGQNGTEERRVRLEAILKETTRLCPPVIGVLRRANQDCVVSAASDEEPDALIPAGFEAWCYFPGANRDPSVLGHDAGLFIKDRYLSREN